MQNMVFFYGVYLICYDKCIADKIGQKASLKKDNSMTVFHDRFQGGVNT